MTTVRPPSPGLVAGQVARHGLLTKIRDLGLELLEVCRTGRTGSM
ncbi:MAG TPA: hypothetical protein VLL69_14010 [Streptosporangiaceae bacterium]|nr:hypothetical protein [Streptosporangiaceae bacterium]